jgi:two-component system CheB/CheR fusion protein
LAPLPEAFGALLRELPANSGMACVLLQHMDPSHKSMLAELLRKATSMLVNEVTNGMKVKPDHV